MNDTVNGDTTESFEYARYWHGYLIFLRPLLTIMNITQIRILLIITFVILSVILLIMTYKKFNFATMLIFLMGMIIADYFYIGISLQGSPVFMICMLSSILLMTEKVKDKKMLFIITGGLTSFFDFLTVPLITLGIPLLLYVLLKQKNKDIKYKELYLDMLKLIIFWGIGYLGIWISKWILVDLIYNKGIVHSVIQQFKYRSSTEGTEKYNIVDVLNMVIMITKIPLIFSVIIIILMSSLKMIFNKKIKFNLIKILPYMFIGLIGIAWYNILANHSYLHSVFTYRNFFFVSICILLMIYNIVEENKKEN